MQMIMAQLMLDDLLHLFPAVRSQLMRIDLDMMAFHEIAAACRGQSPVKRRLVPERNPKALQRDFLNPCLQFFITHLVHRHPVRSFLLPYKCYLNFNFSLGYTVK